MIQYSTQPQKQRAQSPLYFQSSRPRGLLWEYKRSDQSDRTGRLSDSKVAFLMQRDSVTRHLEIHILLISKKRKSSRLLALHNVIFERQKQNRPFPIWTLWNSARTNANTNGTFHALPCQNVPTSQQGGGGIRLYAKNAGYAFFINNMAEAPCL